jgi:hypothetical protein
MSIEQRAFPLLAARRSASGGVDDGTGLGVGRGAADTPGGCRHVHAGSHRVPSGCRDLDVPPLPRESDSPLGWASGGRRTIHRTGFTHGSPRPSASSMACATQSPVAGACDQLITEPQRRERAGRSWETAGTARRRAIVSCCWLRAREVRALGRPSPRPRLRAAGGQACLAWDQLLVEQRRG